MEGILPGLSAARPCMLFLALAGETPQEEQLAGAFELHSGLLLSPSCRPVPHYPHGYEALPAHRRAPLSLDPKALSPPLREHQVLRQPQECELQPELHSPHAV